VEKYRGGGVPSGKGEDVPFELVKGDGGKWIMGRRENRRKFCFRRYGGKIIVEVSWRFMEKKGGEGLT